MQDNRWEQSWVRASDLGLPEPETREMEMYIGDLYRDQIKVRDKEDSLIWDVDQSGKYTPKEDYIKLGVEGMNRVVVWWWKTLWKIHCPPKTRLFMWRVLENKVSCWENLQKKEVFRDRVDVSCAKMMMSWFFTSFYSAHISKKYGRYALRFLALFVGGRG